MLLLKLVASIVAMVGFLIMTPAILLMIDHSKPTTLPISTPERRFFHNSRLFVAIFVESLRKSIFQPILGSTIREIGSNTLTLMMSQEINQRYLEEKEDCHVLRTSQQ